MLIRASQQKYGFIFHGGADNGDLWYVKLMHQPFEDQLFLFWNFLKYIYFALRSEDGIMRCAKLDQVL